MKTVGVIGAGTMGAGIAQVAAQSGFAVVLYDLSATQLEKARAATLGHWRRSVEKGRMAAGAAEAAAQRLALVTDLSGLSQVDVVIEAAPERLEIKQQLFADLEAIVQPETILATNTSSLAVTEVAAAVKTPGRVVGMHFFNPAPLMPLVEVIAGHASDAAAVEATLQLARAFGKTPVRAKDTPGFIVNRVARPYYLEALRIVGSGVAGHIQVDRIMRSGGFKLGPFELMDMIGIDINFAVSQSVYQQFFGEPRFRPHPLQAKMVQSGRLGRKTGHGFYRYDSEGRILGENAQPVQMQPERLHPRGNRVPPAHQHRFRVLVIGREGDVQPWLEACLDSGYAVTFLPEDGAGFTLPEKEVRATLARAAADAFICLDMSSLERADKRTMLAKLDDALPPEALLLTDVTIFTTTELASWVTRSERVVGMGALALSPQSGAVQVGVGKQTAQEAYLVAMTFFRSLGAGVEILHDGPGLVFGRTLACLVNEAALALEEGVATAADIDTAMQLGTNYPMGPLAWGDTIGLDRVVAILETLAAEAGEDRYRMSHLLRQLVRAGYTGKAAGRGFYEYDEAGNVAGLSV